MGIDPVTLSYIAAGFQAVQGVKGFIDNNAAASATKKATAANVLNAQNQLAINKQKQDRINRQNQGERTVKAAASGATIDSFDSVMDDSYQQGLMDIALLEYDSKLSQEQMKYSGAVQSAEYKSAATSSLLDGLGAAAGTAYKGYEQSKQPKVPTTKTKSGETIYWNS
jgi:hypothetical protein